MALDSTTIQEEREKIDQVQVTGILRESDLIEHIGCIDTYSTTVYTGEEKVDFQYSVLSGVCTTDSIYDIAEQPFAENTTVRLSLTQEEPHIMMSGDVLFDPTSFSSLNYILFGALFLMVGIVIGVLLQRKNKNLRA